jgi:hypothetical protein
MSVEAKDVKTLMKILIGAAWLDGKIQPEEREYLHRVVREKALENDPELAPFLYEFRPVKPEECYAWVRQYLGDRPTPEDCQQLMEAISGLIYSDGTVANEEAKLLTELQVLEQEKGGGLEDSSILKAIRGLYQRWVSQLEQ